VGDAANDAGRFAGDGRIRGCWQHPPRAGSV